MDVARPELKQRKRRRQQITVGSIAAGLLVLSISVLSLDSTTPTLSRTDIVDDVVRRGEFLRTARGPGKLVPSQTRWVVARTGASVERILVHPGAIVGAGTAILELSNAEVQDGLLASEASYAAAKADHQAKQAQMRVDLLLLQSSLVTANGEFEVAQVQEEASRLGFEQGVLSAVHYKQVDIEWRQARSRMQIAEQLVVESARNSQAQIKASQSRLDQLARIRESRQLDADALTVKAGTDGEVQQITIEEGQRVEAGANLARIASPDSLMAVLRIAESQAADLIAGQSASIKIGGERLKGKVRRVNPMVDKGTILVEVELLDTLPAGTRSDQSIDGTIVIDRLPDTLYVARPVNSSSESEGTAFRLSGPRKAERVPVLFGKGSTGDIQILRGLKEGDHVIVSDMSNFDQANEVTIE